MKCFRKIISIIMIGIICFSFSACGSDSTTTSAIDIDLTEMSSTMIYSEVSNMVTTPEDFVGKTVKMAGKFAVYHDDVDGNDYFACVIADATACCSQGLEFELKGEHKYPDDYPKVDSEITVQGVFDTYNIGENVYYTLKDAVLL